MSGVFGAVSSDRVDAGAITALNNLSTLTWFLRVYPTTLTGARVLLSKANPGVAGFNLRLNDTSGNLDFRISRTVQTDFITNSAPIGTLSRWYDLAITFDDGASPKVHIYSAVTGSALAEATYGTQTAGSGAWDDSGHHMIVGNIDTAANAFQGRIQTVMPFTSVLSLANLKLLQTHPSFLGSPVLWYECGINGSTTAVDRVGSNNGTVTGMTNAADVPGYTRTLNRFSRGPVGRTVLVGR